jgi:asparagine synthase (glutamine-hydrolysing)
MAWAIEARVPYLDHVVFDRLTGVSRETRVSGGWNKPLLVRAIGDPLVKEAALAPKKGFTFPLHRWIHQSTDELEELALQSGRLERAGVKDLWKSFRADDVHWSRPWAMAVLGSAN